MSFYVETAILILCVFTVVKMAYIDRRIDATKVELIIMVKELQKLRAGLGISEAKEIIETQPPKAKIYGGHDWAS